MHWLGLDFWPLWQVINIEHYKIMMTNTEKLLQTKLWWRIWTPTYLGNLLKLWEITASFELHLPQVYSSSSSSKCFFIKVCILIEEGDVSDWLHLQRQKRKNIRVSFYCIFLKERVSWSYQSKILEQKLAKMTENKAIPNLRCSKYLQTGKINRKSMVDFFLWSSFSTSV